MFMDIYKRRAFEDVYYFEIAEDIINNILLVKDRLFAKLYARIFTIE